MRYFISGIFFLVCIPIGFTCWLILSIEVVPPGKSDLILTLSWSEARLTKTIDLVEDGYADKVLATTGNAYSKLKAAFENEKVEVLYIDPARTTFDEALLLQEVVEMFDIKSVIVVSDYVHLYRASWSIGRFFRDKDVVVFYIPAENEKGPSLGMLVKEIPKVIYYWVWYGLLGRSSHPEWMEIMKEKYSGLVDKYF